MIIGITAHRATAWLKFLVDSFLQDYLDPGLMPAKPEIAALDARVIGLSGYSIFKGDTL